jgi:hypothetical protein
MTGHQRRFTQFTRPVFPSPVASRMERKPSGFPLSFEPRRPEPDNARQGGDRPTEHGPETTLYDISRTSNPACLLVVCDLASHGVIRQRAVARAGNGARGLRPRREHRQGTAIWLLGAPSAGPVAQADRLLRRRSTASNALSGLDVVQF